MTEIEKKVFSLDFKEKESYKEEVLVFIKKYDCGVSIFDTKIKTPVIFQDLKVTREDFHGVKGAYHLKKVLTKEECLQFIKITEKMGFEVPPIKDGTVVEGIRNNKRVIWEFDDQSIIVETLWDRIKDLVPKETTLNKETWKSFGLNQRFRFYRCNLILLILDQDQETFGPHKDGFHTVNQDEISLITFIIYLNDDFQGSNTTFFIGDEKIINIPKQGDGLLFYHGPHEFSPWHEGSPMIKGSKYVLRTDIMFKRNKNL